MKGFSTTEIINECRKGNAKAQLQLYEKHSAVLFTISNRILQDRMKAEDIMQESFVQFFKNSIFTLKNPEAYYAFLKRSVVNKSLDEWKKIKHFVEFDDLENNLEEHDEDQDDVIDTFELKWSNVLEAMKELPEKYRLAVELFYLQEYSHQEIAEMMQISPANSRVILNRAVQKLKSICYENNL